MHCLFLPKSVGGTILETMVRHIGPPTDLNAPKAIAKYKCQASEATPLTMLLITSLKNESNAKVTTDMLKT